MSAISETCNRAYKIWELADFFPNVSFATSERNVIITNKNVKYELTEDLSIDLRLKKISKLHRITL